MEEVNNDFTKIFVLRRVVDKPMEPYVRYILSVLFTTQERGIMFESFFIQQKDHI